MCNGMSVEEKTEILNSEYREERVQSRLMPRALTLEVREIR